MSSIKTTDKLQVVFKIQLGPPRYNVDSNDDHFQVDAGVLWARGPEKFVSIKLDESFVSIDECQN